MFTLVLIWCHSKLLIKKSAPIISTFTLETPYIYFLFEIPLTFSSNPHVSIFMYGVYQTINKHQPSASISSFVYNGHSSAGSECKGYQMLPGY